MKKTTPPDDTGKIQAGQFASGQSGNPLGRPKGSRNKTTLAVQALLEGEAEAISRKAIELAKEGDMAAIKLILERIKTAIHTSFKQGEMREMVAIVMGDIL